MMEKISGLWRDCASEEADERSGGRSFYAVYHDYASDYRGDYTLSLCVESNDVGDFDTDLYAYRSFPIPVDSGGVVSVWKQVWDLEQRGILRRSYSIDFEWYKPDGTATIQIAI
ncbi:hypothetical protein [Bifidobacterium crudilactis]|jgi:predicted transcriptional regulator YdeE|nr:hypothetical protein [Bifidobacterium crudilactis]MDN5973381.1 hypothetical protein [Bifidobacterium crudilactis]MDN6424792.1 hypothetical protein [Bifidobacterium crudilactis]MDN6468180.1 hypothetical protein [Bifidobacterium crudilactis]MDN6587425.1 hypothetical protein [Bifidobacterium crudilactis]MDN6654931.1 hypothetical protein [Bifidobacterium crudilactis]